MELVAGIYGTTLETKRRITFRSVPFDYYNVKEFQDGHMLQNPRELSIPVEVSANTLAMMDSAMREMERGNVSGPVDLSSF